MGLKGLKGDRNDVWKISTCALFVRDGFKYRHTWRGPEVGTKDSTGKPVQKDTSRRMEHAFSPILCGTG